MGHKDKVNERGDLKGSRAKVTIADDDALKFFPP